MQGHQQVHRWHPIRMFSSNLLSPSMTSETSVYQMTSFIIKTRGTSIRLTYVHMIMSQRCILIQYCLYVMFHYYLHQIHKIQLFLFCCASLWLHESIDNNITFITKRNVSDHRGYIVCITQLMTLGQCVTKSPCYESAYVTALGWPAKKMHHFHIQDICLE